MKNTYKDNLTRDKLVCMRHALRKSYQFNMHDGHLHSKVSTS